MTASLVTRAARPGIALVLAGALLPGCFENVSTTFPPGFEPWEEVNLAPMPTPTATDPCPETITFAHAEAYMRSNAMHARACIHEPLDVVWAAIQNPQTGRDPTATAPPFMVLEPIPDECDGAYQTQVHVDDIIDVDFRLCWRHTVAEGTETEPLLTATRWQKVWGTSALRRLEGSLVAHPLDEDPNITVLEYQYHLDAISSDHGTIERYLTVIYGRVRDDAHGIPLLPADF